MMKRFLKFGVIALILAAIVGIKLKFFPSAASSGGAAPKPSGGGIPVSGIIVQPQVLDNKVLANGTIIAGESIELKAETSGRIIRLNIIEGKNVAQGELLVKINDADLQAQLQKLVAQIKLATQTEERQRQLLAINSISQAEYDIALSQLNVIKADTALVKANIDKTELRAPFAGRLGLRNVSLGSYVSPTTILTTIQQTSPVKLDFTIPERYASQIAQNTTLSFMIDGSSRRYKATVYAAESQIDVATRSLKMRALCPNPDNSLQPGMYAKVELPLKNVDKALMIPTEAVIPILKGQQVYLCKGGVAQPQKVETGVRTDSTVQITSGLQPGDTVITTGIMQLKPNSKINVTSVM